MNPKPAGRDEFSKPTYRAANEPFKVLGLIDWRYAVIGAMPSLFIGLLSRQISHSKMTGLLAGAAVLVFLEWQGYRVSSVDPARPLAIVKSLLDKRHLCAFKKD